ncbi:MAG: hypothetical protein NT007_12875 [Candidatus Kapabacteria bacterium]|nr:hypothetical protein [Candidatus Kapabacteria bacterium]
MNRQANIVLLTSLSKTKEAASNVEYLTKLHSRMRLCENYEIPMECRSRECGNPHPVALLGIPAFAGMTEIEVFTQSHIQESPSSSTFGDSCILRND